MRLARRGFTLVELLVTFSIIAVLIGISIGTANYIRQRQTTELNAFAREVKAHLELARKRALSSEVPGGCTIDSFLGYGLTITLPSTIKLDNYCGSLTPTPSETFNFATKYSNTTIQAGSAATILFKKDNGALQSAAAQKILLQESGTSKYITICISLVGKITSYTGNVACP